MRIPASTKVLLAVQLVILVGAIPALAEEITVQNDSVTDFGQAVIVGDFVAGEEAGVVLTSPCDGTIVAVQILWLEGSPGHGQSLEQAIHIYQHNGGGFPVPGTELVEIVGPVMTPGFFNEIRYLDEAQTIPLSVPVTENQQFYVTLEFANPTSVGTGGPSVVRDVSGCQAGKNVLFAIPGGWLNFCLFLSGDLAIRAVIDCPSATGACCHADGTCSPDVEEGQCQGFGDVWSEGLTCGQVSCVARGGCCLGGGCLQLVEQATCEGISGVFAGGGANCDDDVCVEGACCMLDGSCQQEFGFACDALGGTFQGTGIGCDPNPCPQPLGACCFGEFCIGDQTEENCSGAGGAWAGAFTNCDDNNGNTIPDECETCVQNIVNVDTGVWYCVIQNAIAAASPGDVIEVLPGTYNEGVNFQGKEITLRSAGGPSVTTLDGTGLGDSVVKCISAEGPQTILDGFTITSGSAANGGAAFISGADPTFVNLRLLGNGATSNGGAVYCDGGSSPTFVSSVISGNTSTAAGGGVYISGNSSPVFTNCLISENLAGTNGGGVYGVQWQAPGGFFNSTVAGNTATTAGGGMYVTDASSPALFNSILWENQAASGTQMALVAGSLPSTVTVLYCNVEGGQAAALVDPGETLSWVAGNITTDPQFRDSNNGDYWLLSNSPCIDAGFNAGVPADIGDLDNDGNTSERTPLDLDLRVRVVDVTFVPNTGSGICMPGSISCPMVDMGAYEYPMPIPDPPLGTP